MDDSAQQIYDQVKAIERDQRERFEAERATAAKKLEDARAEEARRPEVAKRLLAARGTPVSVAFKDLANFPEGYVERCIRVEGVWMDGDLERMEQSQAFSVGLGSRDGKWVHARTVVNGYSTGLVFYLPADIGRPLALTLNSGSQYGVNACFELTKSGQTLLGRIYRLEMRNQAGEVKDVYQAR